MPRIEMTPELDKFLDDAVKLVRAHEKIGRGTCSVIDEAYGDTELKEHIIEHSLHRFEQGLDFNPEDIYSMRKPIEPRPTLEQIINDLMQEHELFTDRGQDARASVELDELFISDEPYGGEYPDGDSSGPCT